MEITIVIRQGFNIWKVFKIVLESSKSAQVAIVVIISHKGTLHRPWNIEVLLLMWLLMSCFPIELLSPNSSSYRIFFIGVDGGTQ